MKHEKGPAAHDILLVQGGSTKSKEEEREKEGNKVQVHTEICQSKGIITNR